VGQQSFKDLFSGQSDFGRNRFRRKIVGIDFIFAQLVMNAQLIEQADRIGLVGHGKAQSAR
jgi:hypothetical protein